MSDPLDAPVRHELLGDQVRVRLDDRGDNWRAGRLLRLSVSGDADLLLDDGAVLYCWPALEIQPRPELTEVERRELADAHRDEVVEGSAVAIEPWRRGQR